MKYEKYIYKKDGRENKFIEKKYEDKYEELKINLNE